jgi:hypothetical protein
VVGKLDGTGLEHVKAWEAAASQDGAWS